MLESGQFTFWYKFLLLFIFPPWKIGLFWKKNNLTFTPGKDNWLHLVSGTQTLFICFSCWGRPGIPAILIATIWKHFSSHHGQSKKKFKIWDLWFFNPTPMTTPLNKKNSVCLTQGWNFKPQSHCGSGIK